MSAKKHYIYIGQYYGKSLVSRLIKWRTWSDISHSAAFCPDFEHVIEAWVGGVRKCLWTEGHTPGTRIDIYRVQCTQEQQIKFYAGMEKEIGKGYDYIGLFGFVFRSSKMNDLKKWFCSKLVFAKAMEVKLYLLLRTEPYQASPGLINRSPEMKLWKTLTTP